MNSYNLQTSFGNRVHELRESLGLTQKEVSRRANIPVPHLAEYERGTQNPSLKIINAIAIGLGVRVSELFAFDEDAQNEGISQDPDPNPICERIQMPNGTSRTLAFRWDPFIESSGGYSAYVMGKGPGDIALLIEMTIIQTGNAAHLWSGKLAHAPNPADYFQYSAQRQPI